MPPAVSPDSRMRTFRPARARYDAHTRPLWPAPMMITSLRSIIAELVRGRVRFAQVAQDFTRRIRARCAHYATARVGRRAAHVHALHGASIWCVTRKGPIEHELVER